MININEQEYESAKQIFKCYLRGDAGSFHTKLLDAWGMSDSINRQKLECAFPEFAQAIKEYNNELKEKHNAV